MSRRATKSAHAPDLGARALLARLAAANAPLVLDVRSRAEYLRGHVPGALHVPFWAALWRARHLPASRDDLVVVYCGHGPRARIAQSLLRLRGFTRVACLAGHMSGWRRAGHPEHREGRERSQSLDTRAR